MLFIIAVASSCKKLIELPGNPPAKITEAQQFIDSATTMTAVAGVYSYPTRNEGGSFTFNNGSLSLCTGLSSDELSTTNATYNLFYSYSLTPLNGVVSGLWIDPYTGLYPVNAILQQVPLSNGLSASFKKQILAEMKVVRALYYFNLVNLFGGVPLVLSTDYKATSILPRSSVDEVYNQILKDLTEAQRDLPEKYPSAGRARPNLSTVNAFLAKVRLYHKEWQAAADAATKVIAQSTIYRLETDLDRVFLDGSAEAIWQLPAYNPSTLVTTREATNFVPRNSTTFPTYSLTSYLLNAFEPGDLRMQKWVGIAIVSGSPARYYPYKYKNFSGNPTNEDFMIFRLAEQYLIRAEARIHLSNIPEAIDDLNFVRSRSRPAATVGNPNPLPNLDRNMSEANAIKALMKERQTEFFTEWGNRWFDLKRTGAADEVLGAEKMGWNHDEALYPVPQTQREKNPFLTQNLGYQ